MNPKQEHRGNPIINMQGIVKKFPGVLALNKIDLDIYPGKVHGIVGENGAGKSTLMKILGGFYPDYEGEIEIDGNSIWLSNPRQAQELGIALVHQELSLVPELSVGENIFLGREQRTWFPGIISRKQAERLSTDIFREMRVAIQPSKKVNQLSVAQQQLVEIAKGLSTRSRVLILDEPTSSLTSPEIKDLFKVIRILTGKGTAIIYISHKLPEVLEITDRITVLRDGVCLMTKPTSELNEGSLIKAMVGRELSIFFSRRHGFTKDQVILEVKKISRSRAFRNISFKLFKGEVLGVYGLVGAGRTEVAEAIFGLAPAENGEIQVDGSPAKIKSPMDAISHNIVLVPEDRRNLGLISMLSVRKNLSLPNLRRLSSMEFIKRREEEKMVREAVETLEIRTSSWNALVETLSGGNQQKVVLGKWLAMIPKILILDEPTRGIDVGAKAEVRIMIDRLAAQGMGILLISSELPEILGMSDRVLVMREGVMVGEFIREDCSEEVLGAAAAGVKMTDEKSEVFAQ
jgi:ABC-type sugar transport system ATPase subunit